MLQRSERWRRQERTEEPREEESGRLQAEARSPEPHVDPRSLQDWEKWHCKHFKEQKPRSRTQLLH